MTANPLPAHPDIEQYRKQAKELLKRHAAGEADAIDRIQRHHPRLRAHTAADVQRAVFKLADAQLVVARELGFASWPKFIAHVRDIRRTAPADSFLAHITTGAAQLQAEIAGCTQAAAVVQFVLAGPVSRHDPGVRQIAARLNRASFCTVLTDLFTAEEELQDAINEDLRFDLQLLARRALAVTAWIRAQQPLAHLPVGYLGSGTGAAACMLAAVEADNPIKAVVSSAGRPDLAGPWLARVQAPMLFIVGANDTVGFGFTRTMMPVIQRHVPSHLITIEGAAQRFAPGTPCDRVATLAREWFTRHLVEVRS